jgi:multidrug resistance efflux pump
LPFRRCSRQRWPGCAATRGGRLGRLSETDWKQRALTAEAALEEARTETARLWSELHQRRADENELAYYRSLYESQVDSVSWKVTRPLRDAKVLAAKVQRKLAER